jgi:hypothetical protein
MTPSATVADTVPDFYHEKTRFKGIFGWIFSTDHKRIGLLYLFAVITFFVVGMILGVLMRLEMLTPENTIVTPQTYNTFFTLHGIIMIFLVVIPALPAVFGNFPLQGERSHLFQSFFPAGQQILDGHFMFPIAFVQTQILSLR